MVRRNRPVTAEIYQFASIGEVNGDLKCAGEPARVEIGDRNRIAKASPFIVVQCGAVGGLTAAGSDVTRLMINAHVAI